MWTLNKLPILSLSQKNIYSINAQLVYLTTTRDKLYTFCRLHVTYCHPQNRQNTDLSNLDFTAFENECRNCIVIIWGRLLLISPLKYYFVAEVSCHSHCLMKERNIFKYRFKKALTIIGKKHIIDISDYLYNLRLLCRSRVKQLWLPHFLMS